MERHGTDGNLECMSRYEPLRMLGRGSYGTVVLVRKRCPEGAVSSLPASAANSTPGSGAREAGPLLVIKEVDLLDVDDKCRTEALSEAEVLQSLSHPNIIGYDDAFVCGERLCIVMEYADRGDLSASIERRRASGHRYHEREAMAVFSQLALALQYVHERRVIHRDVKTQNVFLTSAKVVKLGDFGVARVLAASQCCAETQIGTPFYVPPEVCENHPYDFKADVWGLGVVLYELLALERPFSSSSIAALAVKICTAEPRPVSSAYSTEVRALVSQLLAKRAEDRPSSTETVALPHVRRAIAALPACTRQFSHHADRAGDSGADDAACHPPSSVGPGVEDRNGLSPICVLRRRASSVLKRVVSLPNEVSGAIPRRLSPKKARTLGDDLPPVAGRTAERPAEGGGRAPREQQPGGGGGAGTPTLSARGAGCSRIAASGRARDGSPKKARGVTSPKKGMVPPSKKGAVSPKKRIANSPKKLRLIVGKVLPGTTSPESDSLGPGVIDELIELFLEETPPADHLDKAPLLKGPVPGADEENSFEQSSQRGLQERQKSRCSELLDELVQEFGWGA